MDPASRQMFQNGCSADVWLQGLPLREQARSHKKTYSCVGATVRRSDLLAKADCQPTRLKPRE